MTEHRQYEGRALEPGDLDPDPIAQFRRWFDDARSAAVTEPEAMMLSTAGPDGPAARIVLLRVLDERGFGFFTNYESAKARAIETDPAVALTFGWLELHRQVRITGTAERLPAAESDAYFAGRPRGAQIGAWASPQSEVIGDRAELDRRVAELEASFGETEPVPRPEGWGGYIVRPAAIELWQGRLNRLHDRLRYRRVEAPPAKLGAPVASRRRDQNGWLIERLAP